MPGQITKRLVLLTGCVLIITVLVLQPETNEPQETWYQLTWRNQKVGSFRELRQTQSARIQIRQETRVTTKNQGSNYGFTEVTELNFAKQEPQLLEDIFYRYESTDEYFETRLKRQGTQLKGVKISNNQKSSLSIDSRNYSLADFDALNQWLKKTQANNTTYESFQLNARQGQWQTVVYRLSNHNDEQRRFVYGTSMDKLDKSLWLNNQGEVVRHEYNDLIKLTRLTSKHDLVEANAVDFYNSQMLTIDQPLGDVSTIVELELRVPDSLSLENIKQTPRQLLNGNRLTLMKSQDALSDPVFDSVPSLNLQTQKRLQSMIDPLFDRTDTDFQKLTKLRHFVANYLIDRARISETGVEALLDRPEGDCTEHTRLFNTMATLVGYKARSVNGLVYLGDELQGFGGHQWSEVWVNGQWYAYDATWNIEDLSATHIRLENDQPLKMRANQKGKVAAFDLLTIKRL